MRFQTLGATIIITALAACSATAEPRFAAVDEADQKTEFAKTELAKGDWSEAEAALMGAEFSEEDQVFAKINLAFVYSATGRKERAVAMYREILAAKENPYALTNAGTPKRVKTIAKLALARLGEK